MCTHAKLLTQYPALKSTTWPFWGKSVTKSDWYTALWRSTWPIFLICLLNIWQCTWLVDLSYSWIPGYYKGVFDLPFCDVSCGVNTSSYCCIREQGFLNSWPTLEKKVKWYHTIVWDYIRSHGSGSRDVMNQRKKI